mgnify:CR=1 FL=1
MTLLYFLTLFPLVPALSMLLARGDRARDAVGLIGSGIIMAVTVVVAVMFFGTGPQSFEVAPGTSHVLSIISSVIDVILCAVILYNAYKYRNALTTVLGIVQLVGSLAFAAMTLPATEAVTATPLYLDYMSVIMVLAVGIVGSLICVYALGYMKDFQAHDEHEAALRGQTAPDRRPQFLALMFLFLSAMFVIVTSDNLEWLFCGWEITTVCSFLMIGYTRTPEAIKNAFTQIILNMLGGIAFLAGLMFLHVNGMPLTISGMIELSGAGTAQSALLVMPVVLLSLAALTKPHRCRSTLGCWAPWLPPRPRAPAALVHHGQSRRVPDGQAEPALCHLSRDRLYGHECGCHHVFARCPHGHLAEQRQTRARVLHHFQLGPHQCLLGCRRARGRMGGHLPDLVPHGGQVAAVPVRGHGRASYRQPQYRGHGRHVQPHAAPDASDDAGHYGHVCGAVWHARVQVGRLVAFAQTGNVLMIMVLAFGSAATFYFWGKWLAKLSGVDPTAQNVEVNVHKTEWMALNTIAALLILCCVAFPVISSGLVSPYLAMVFGRVPYVIGKDAMYLMVVIVAFIAWCC